MRLVVRQPATDALRDPRSLARDLQRLRAHFEREARRLRDASERQQATTAAGGCALWLRELAGEQVEPRKLDVSTHARAAVALQRLRTSPQLAQLPDPALARAMRCNLQTLRYAVAWASFRELRDELRGSLVSADANVTVMSRAGPARASR